MKLDRHHAQDCRESSIISQEIDGSGRCANAHLFFAQFQIFRLPYLQEAMAFKVPDLWIGVCNSMATDTVLAAEPFGMSAHGCRKDVEFSISPVFVHFQTLLLSVNRTREPTHA
ncbi:hypothetical protein [Achromobacter denitrificans]|uniref:hypothetical protein n=1 Tax=Achromobacter denitrificans TaxID=32002 RepID=UPI003B9B88A8